MSWPFRSERGIGRGEVAESRIEAPLFAFFALVCAVALFIFHILVQDNAYTVALALSMLVFGITTVRVEYGLFVLVAAMMLSPEITAGSVGQHGERAVNIRYNDVMIGVIFLGVLVKLAFEGRPEAWIPNPINAGILAYYFICIVSSLRAVYYSVPAWDQSVAFFVMLKMLQFYMIFYMVSMAVRTRDEVRRQLAAFFFIALIVCGYGISTIGRLPRVSAPFEAGGTEPNTFGGYLMLVMVLALALYLFAPERRLRIGFALIAFTAFVPFVMTLSRASYVAFLIALAAVGVFARRPVVLVGVAVVLLASPFLMPQDVLDRVNYTFQRGSGVPLEIGGVETNLQVDKSTWERIYIWQKVRFNLSVWPWLGGGISWENVLDSQYARVLIETGILGMLTFAFLFIQILRTTRQAFRWSRDWMLKGMSLGALAVTIGLIVHGLGTISFLIVRIMEPFWFVVALTVVAREIALQNYYQRLREYHAAVAAEKQRKVDDALPPRAAEDALAG